MSNAGKRSLPLYISSPQSCDYIDGETSQSLFISPDIKVDSGTYEYLLGVGFRRSGTFVYKPHCSDCDACKPSRVAVADFNLSRSQKRVRAKNKDLDIRCVEAGFNERHYQLYLKYQKSRHVGGSMENFDEKAYKDFLCQSLGESVFIESWLGDKLVAVALTDVFGNAVSAVYTFFDPDYSTRSLGTYSVLEQIEFAKSINKRFLYLGYYIQASQKMSYKKNFQPLELLHNEKWERFKASTDTE